MANSVHKTATYAFLVGLALLASADGKPVSESKLKRSADCKPVSESRLKRSDDGGPVGVVVEQLSSHVTSLSAQLTALSSKVAILEAKAGKDETVIAFHARQEVHDFEVLPRGPIILQHVTTRVGTGYDEKTGWFQAPMSGTYLFVATVTVVSPDIA
ncbi:hypothetical protein V1264_017802 [Littorina saxatilis]|uniref:C1q domain-containing protein n=1 Tax=Littorina saxatilis TaxID=31220 RepID=A0AAN9GG47_9CAEN